MPDEIKPNTEVSQNPSGPVITTEQKTTEVLDANGNNLNSGHSALGSIFDKVAAGDKVESAVAEVMKKPERAPREEPEVKPAVVIEKKPDVKSEPSVTKEEAKIDEERASDDELQVLPHDKPKTAVRIKTLLNKLHDVERMRDETKKEAETKAARAAELEAELTKVKSADPLTNEKVKSSLDELAMYRRRYELDTLPEVKEKFDGKIANAEQTIEKSLKGYGFKDDILGIIKEEGGWLKFIDSQRSISLANGKNMTAADFAEAVKQALPVSERRRLDALELEQVQTKRDKETYFNEETKRAKEYFAERENQTKAQQEAQQKAMNDAGKVLVDWKKRFAEENEYLREKSVTDGLTTEQKAALEDHNKNAKQLNQLIEKHLSAKDLPAMLEVLADAIQYHHERTKLAASIAENQRLKDQLKASEEKLEKFKRAGGTTPRAGSLSAGIHQTTQEPKKAQTLEEAFDAMAAAKTND